MFEILFGWRKATRCKKLVKRVQCRLKLLINKRDSIVRQLREDIGELIQRGHEQSAFVRVEQLCKDQNIKTAYNLIEHFCEFILINLPYIQRHRDCPNDINEAVSSLLFASARCGDLPELQKLRKLFGERYGHTFTKCAVELLAGNLVNCQIIEKLSTKSIADDMKLVVMKEIARDKNLKLGCPEVDGRFEVQQLQVSELLLKDCEPECEEQVREDIGETQSPASDNKDKKESTMFYGSKPDQKKQVANPCKSYDNCGTKLGSAVGDAIALQIDIDVVEQLRCSLIHESPVKLEKCECQGPSQKLERITAAPSECSSNLSERSFVYLDDIKEFKPKTKDVIEKDQRLFMFEPTVLLLANNLAVIKDCLSDTQGDGFTRDPIEPCEPSDGKTSSSGSTQTQKSSRKRLKRRSRCSILTVPIVKNPEYALYYGESVNSSTDDEIHSQKSHPQRNHQRKISVEGSVSSSFSNRRNAMKTSNKVYCKEMTETCMSGKCKYYHGRTHSTSNFNHDMDIDCFLEQPRYLRTSDIKDDWQSKSSRVHSGSIRSINFSQKGLKLDDENFHCQATGNDEKDSEMCYENSSISGATNLISSQCHRQFKETDKVEVTDCQVSYASSRDSCSSSTTSSTLTSVRPPYSRAMTLPLERPKCTNTSQIQRSASCLSQQSNNHSQQSSSSSSCSHVHPKLPDYEDLAIRFKALKEERMQNSTGEVNSGLSRA